MKKKQKYPKEFLEHIKSITNKRANIVINHIMKHGFITTEDLKKLINTAIHQERQEM